jgi:hypothetical protein
MLITYHRCYFPTMVENSTYAKRSKQRKHLYYATTNQSCRPFACGHCEFITHTNIYRQLCKEYKLRYLLGGLCCRKKRHPNSALWTRLLCIVYR